jgi:hypothetical protein
MIQQIMTSIQRLMGWFFGAPFRQIPPEFGQTTPTELLAFEAKAEEMQRHPSGNVQPSSSSASPQTNSHHQ